TLLGRHGGPGATWMALRRALEDRFEGRVPVRIRAVEVDGEPAVLFSARVAGQHAVAPQHMLAHNTGLPVGALCLDEDSYVLRPAAPLAWLSLPGAVRAVELIAGEARRLARRFSIDVAAVGAAYAD